MGGRGGGRGVWGRGSKVCSCNINSRSFSRSTMSAFLCSSKILSIIYCIHNSLPWNVCNWFCCNFSSYCWNELFVSFSFVLPAFTCFQILRLFSLLYHCFCLTEYCHLGYCLRKTLIRKWRIITTLQVS